MNTFPKAQPGDRPSVTVVVPVYNEAPSLERVVDEISATLAEQAGSYRVLVLDDGSTDWSGDLERRLAARRYVRLERFPRNRGKGAVLDRAFRLLDTELTVVIDADGEYAASDLPRVLQPLREGRADWVMGSRYGFGRARPTQYLLTFWVNRVINLWFHVLSGIRLHDLLTGVYAFRSDLVADLRLRERRFSYTAELMWKVLQRRGIRIVEVPVSYRFRSYAEGKKIRWWETATIVLALLRYRRTSADGHRS